MPDYLDLHIINDDLAPDAGGLLQKLADLAAIAQDIVHMIREAAIGAPRLSLKQQSEHKEKAPSCFQLGADDSGGAEGT